VQKIYFVLSSALKAELAPYFLIIKAKVKLSWGLIKHNAMKTYWGWRYSFIHSLTSALDGGEWSVSCTSHFTPRERDPGTHWIGGWVGPSTVLDVVVKRKTPSPCWALNPRTLIVQPVAQCHTD
jgi:hypothetical protein